VEIFKAVKFYVLPLIARKRPSFNIFFTEMQFQAIHLSRDILKAFYVDN